MGKKGILGILLDAPLKMVIFNPDWKVTLDWSQLEESNMSELFLVRGLPGSGKSAYAKELADDDGFKHFEADQYHMVGDEYRYNPRSAPAAHEDCFENTLNALKRGENVVVSNTFTTIGEMQAYLDLVKTFDVEIEVVCMKTQFESHHGIPEDIVKKMVERWEPYRDETCILPKDDNPDFHE